MTSLTVTFVAPIAPFDTADADDWPGPDTPVLVNRRLVDGTDPRTLSRFADDRWDLNPAVFEQHKRSISVNFELIPPTLRQDAKLYLWVLINRGLSTGEGAQPDLSVETIRSVFTCQLQFLLQWFAQQGVTRLDQVTDEMLWDYLAALEAEQVPYTQRYRLIYEVRRLWRHREVMPPRLRLPQAPPWDGEDTADLLGRTRGDRENRTHRIGEDSMQMLLSWALRFVQDFSADILAAWADYQRWRNASPERRRRRDTADGERNRPGDVAAAAERYLEQLRRSGQTLPGIRDEHGVLQVRWRHLAQILNCCTSIRFTGTGRMIRECGIPIGETTWLPTPITGVLHGRPWREPGIAYDQVPQLARLLSTACFIVISYLSGARVGEVLNLRRGCVHLDKPTGLWLMEGLYFKDTVDEHGNKIPEGVPRPDPWVIIEPVAWAVAILERLHTSPLLFPNRLDEFVGRVASTRRSGEGRNDRLIAADLGAFVDWVNAECARLGWPDPIPADPWPLVASRFRRTLAWFIRRRPRGLIANSIQYGHTHTRMTQGYAGSYESGFPDEYAYEDYLYRLDTLAEDERALADGEQVSGPAADTYRSRVAAASDQFAGRVVPQQRRIRDLLGNPLLQIHHGEGMTCMFNPATAACQIRGAADDPMVTPDVDDCRPRCPNIARTDRDIAWVRQRAAELAEVVADPLAPPIRHEREKAELERLRAIITDHEANGDRQ